MRDKPGCSIPAIVLLATALLAVAGCHQPEPPPAAYVGPTLDSADLGLEPVRCPATGFVVFEQQTSRGRFPGALAVARLVPADEEPACGGPAPPHWRLGTTKEEEATYWNSLFNTISNVREVVILDELSVERPEPDLAEITAAACRTKANLCLIWGPTATEPDHAALMGVIMDAQQSEPVAVVRAQAGPDEFKEPPEDCFKGDRRYEDVNYLVARKFEQQVKDCLCELIARDQELATTLPSPWRAAATQPVEHPAIPVYIVPNQPTGW